LSDGRVELVTAGWASAFVLVVDMRGCVQQLFQPPRADQWGGTVKFIDLAHRLRDFDVAFGTDLLVLEMRIASSIAMFADALLKPFWISLHGSATMIPH
jgi:hypothetical protein